MAFVSTFNFGRDDDGFLTEADFILFSKIVIPFRLTLCCFGTVLNVLCVKAYHKIGLDNSVTIVFFFLAVLDLFHLLASIGQAVIMINDILIREQLLWIDSHLIIFFIFNTVNRLFIEPAFLATAFLAVQRCLCVVKPLSFKEFFTRRRTYVFLALNFSFCFAFYFGLVLQNEFVEILIPVGRKQDLKVIMFVIPFWKDMGNSMFFIFNVFFNASTQVIISVCVFMMARALAKSVRFRQGVSSSSSEPKRVPQTVDGNEDSKATATPPAAAAAAVAVDVSNTKERHAITQVSLVCVIYLVCNIPRLFVAITTMIAPEMDSTKPDNLLFLVCYTLYLMFEDLNSSLNFFVYYKYNSKFRQACFGAPAQSQPKV